MIGVSKATLSRDAEAKAQRAGRREKRFAPAEVMRLAEFHKRVSVNEVARALLAHTEKRDPAAVDAVEAEIDAYFASRKHSLSGKDAFFADLQRVLPPALYTKVRHAYLASEGLEPPDVVSDMSDEEIEEYGV